MCIYGITQNDLQLRKPPSFAARWKARVVRWVVAYPVVPRSAADYPFPHGVPLTGRPPVAYRFQLPLLKG